MRYGYLWVATGALIACVGLAAANPVLEAIEWPLPLAPWQPAEAHMAAAFGKPSAQSLAAANGIAGFSEAEQKSLCRFRAVLTVPETGDYRFFITVEGSGTLSISDDPFLSNKKQVACVTEATHPGKWSQFPSQASGTMHWEKGEKHAIEMLWKNMRNKGQAAIAWQRPGDSEPTPLPLMDAAGNALLSPYQESPGDTDHDDLPDEWELAHKLAVDASNGAHSGYGDPDGDGLTNQQEYLRGTDPLNTAGQPGLVNFKAWRNFNPGSKTLLETAFPNDLPWILENQTPEASLLHLENLQPPFGADAVWACFLLTAKTSGYHLLSAEAGGALQVMLSADATPEHLRLLWDAGSAKGNHTPGFTLKSEITESAWIYLEAGRPRLVDIRYLHLGGQAFLNVEWTTPDGTRQKIPDDCISPWQAEGSDALPPYASMADGDWRTTLQGATLEPKPIDLSKSKALTTGWSDFNSQLELAHGDVLEEELNRGLACPWGGSLELPFTTSEDGHAVLSTRVALLTGIPAYARVSCEREIDGIRFGRQPITAANRSAPVFRCVTPWLKAGKHTLRLHLEPMEHETTAVLIHASMATVSDSALIGKIQTQLARENRFLPQRGDGGFQISPACIEIASRVSQAPELRGNGRKHPLQPASTGTWWADVPLPESGKPLKLDAHFAADRMHVPASAHWQETRISEHSELFVRVGDSLRLTAAPAVGSPTGAANPKISFRGRDIPTPPGKPFVCRFDKPGTETVTGMVSSESESAGPHQLTIHVLPRMAEPSGPPPVISKDVVRTARVVRIAHYEDRTLRLKDLPAGAWPDGGAALSFRACPVKATDNSNEWLVFNTRAGTLPAVLRAGPAGPILGQLTFSGVIAGYDYFSMTDADAPQDAYLFQPRVTGLPQGWKIQCRVTGADTPLYPDKDYPNRTTVWPWRMGHTAGGDCWFKYEKKGFSDILMFLIQPDRRQSR